ncbi:hypothetical protein [Aeromonas veronii]|uniref:hypothetical protein n=1 Tax=Aeromonas veronii TaxID=654 RepID=UPI001E5C3D5C|nr:hypothetical protein [Aeromonas veronii]MCD6620003.1 hypothetical protein [Aeromonas veronii]
MKKRVELGEWSILMPSKNCRVCGYELDDYPWGEDGNSPTWDICSCCGTEFGYEDCTLPSVRKKRQDWIAHGCEWFEKKSKPINWSLEHQFENIPDEYK